MIVHHNENIRNASKSTKEVNGVKTEKMSALAIFDDIMSDAPTYGYDFESANGCGRQLSFLADVRKRGIETATRVVESIKARPDSELAVLLAEREREGQGDEEPVGTLMSEVTPKPINWLWYGKLALGKLQMLDGPPDLGKTTIAYDLIARASRGGPMPGESKTFDPMGSVVICLEEDIEDTIQPKLAKAGAVLSRIVSLGFLKEKTTGGKEYHIPFSLASHLPQLEKAIQRVNAKIIFIDPIMNVLGNKDTYKDNEVRNVLAPLVALAAQYGAVVICIRHTTKGSGDDKLIHQGMGSIAFIGLSRIGLMVKENPENENQGIFFTPKNNLIPKEHRTKLLYTIVSDSDDPTRPYVRWDGFTSISDQELTRRPQDNQGGNRTAIYKCLKDHAPDPMKPQQIADELALDLNVVAVTLTRMFQDGQIDKQGRGQYVAK